MTTPRSSPPSRNGSIHCYPPGRAMTREPRSCAPRSSSTARSGIAWKVFPVDLERPLLTGTTLSTLPADAPDWGQHPARDGATSAGVPADLALPTRPPRITAPHGD